MSQAEVRQFGAQNQFLQVVRLKLGVDSGFGDSGWIGASGWIKLHI